MRVWVNGTFDVLHVGHVRLLEFAAKFGKLRVGIDTDNRVKELKGFNRPFNNQEDRKKILESLKFVNDVVLFNTQKELIESIKNYSPDVMVIGSDYQGKQIFGSEYAEKLIFFDRIPEYSTTKILNFYKND